MQANTHLHQPNPFMSSSVKKAAKPVVSNDAQNEYLDELGKLLSIPKKKNGLTFASLFAGGGGLDLGFSAAGFKPSFTTDIVDSFCSTIRKNLPGDLVEAWDMNDLKGSYVKDKVGEIDFVIGGPPCQSFSILGNRGATLDPRGKLVFEYVRFIKEVNPRGFLFENVPGLLSVNQGKDWEMILRFFKETGYHIYWERLNSAEYGVPQLRERVVLIGFRDEVDFKWPTKKFSIAKNSSSKLPTARTSGAALKGMESTLNHDIRIHSDRVASRYSKLAPGERDRTDHTDRIHPDRPSGTVLVGSGGGGGRPFIHPFEHRHLTVREAARLQSFPDWWEFKGTVTSQYRQVGNAVPALMAYHVAKSIAKALS